jgi:hypothetical protein
MSSDELKMVRTSLQQAQQAVQALREVLVLGERASDEQRQRALDLAAKVIDPQSGR